MRKINITKFFIAFLAIIFVAGSTETFAQRGGNFRVDTGQKIRVRMEDEISSKISQVGDRFNTKVVEPVYSNSGVIVVPTGSTVVGQISSLTKAKKAAIRERLM